MTINSSTPSLLMMRRDYERLSSLVQRIDSDIASLLEHELERAQVVSGEEIPQGVVTMNSEVRFQDLDTGKESHVVLVYPQEADIQKSRISILAPVGAALIGLRVGQSIDWPLPNGKRRRLKVISVREASPEDET